MTERAFRFLAGNEQGGFSANHANDPDRALMAVCVASQQAAGFGALLHQGGEAL